jgi:predicted phage replisome organizer
MAGKKFYWLKLKRDFFKRHDIRIIESMPNGKDYILFYLKMLLESIDHEGELRFSDAIPYNEQMLSVITNTNIDIVKAAMKLFIDLRMVDVMDDQTIYMMEVEKLIGSESESAVRMRRHRANARPSLCDANVQNSDTEIEIELEKETEQEEEIEEAAPPPSPKPVRHKYGSYKNVLFTDEDYAKLQAEFPHDYSERIERLSEYIASTGKSYKNHLATIRSWARKEKPKKSGNVFKDMLEEEMYG